MSQRTIEANWKHSVTFDLLGSSECGDTVPYYARERAVVTGNNNNILLDCVFFTTVGSVRKHVTGMRN